MTPTELITSIEQIKRYKLDDIKGRVDFYTNSSFFIVINKDNSLRRESTISFVYNGGFNYALFIVDFGYLQQQIWHKNSWEFAAIITPTGIISSILGENWSMVDLYFNFTPYGSMAPSFVFSLNSSPDKKITYDTSPDKFDLAWKFFRELDLNCSSLPEAEIYIKYYKEKLSRKDQETTLDLYKAEVEQKESIINQYKDLLELIEEKMKQS